MMADLFAKNTAEISACGKYRYFLQRRWGDGNCVTWIMLNPSTADHTIDDPTIRRCCGFSRSWGYSGIFVVNLFAYRSPSPKDLLAASDPVGEHNKEWCLSAFDMSKNQYMDSDPAPIIAAWGRRGSFMNMENTMLGWADEAGVPLHCLTKDGLARANHPLYLPKHLTPVKFA